MKKLLVFVLCLLLASAAAAWFFTRSSDKGRSAVPADATSIVVFQPDKLIAGLGLKTADLKSLPSSLRDFSEAVDLAKPIYAFSTASGKTGLSLTLRDARKLTQAADSYGFTAGEQQGLRWITSGNSVGCIDNDKLLLYAPVAESEAANLRPEMVRLMKQGKQDVPLLSGLSDKGFLRINTALDQLPKELTDNLPEGIDLHDARLSAALGIGSKDITLSAELLSPGTTSADDMLRPIAGKVPDFGTDSPFFCLQLNMKGEKLLEFLRKQPQLRTALLGLNMAVDVDMMLKAIDGDITIVVPKLDLRRPDVVLTANLSNEDFLANADDWDGVTRRGTSDFMASLQGMQAYFGAGDGKLYLATSEALANLASASDAATTVSPASKGKYLYASLGAAEIIKAYPALSLALIAVPQLSQAVESIEGLTLSADSPQSYELSLRTNRPVKDVVGRLIKH